MTIEDMEIKWGEFVKCWVCSGRGHRKGKQDETCDACFGSGVLKNERWIKKENEK